MSIKRSFVVENEQELFKKFRLEHDIAMGYVKRPEGQLPKPSNPNPIWSLLESQFPVPANLIDIGIGHTGPIQRYRAKFDCFGPALVSCLCFKCQTQVSNDIKYFNRIMSEKEKIEMDYSPIYSSIQYVNVREVQESANDEDMPVIINAVHFYDDDEPVRSNICDTPKFTRVMFRTKQSPDKVKRFWILRRDIMPTQLRF